MDHPVNTPQGMMAIQVVRFDSAQNRTRAPNPNLGESFVVLGDFYRPLTIQPFVVLDYLATFLKLLHE
jgi:hypothetical protein